MVETTLPKLRVVYAIHRDFNCFTSQSAKFALVLFFHDVPLGIGLLIIILGVPVYWLGVCWEKKPKAFQRFMISLTHGAQKLFVCVPEEEEKDE